MVIVLIVLITLYLVIGNAALLHSRITQTQLSSDVNKWGETVIWCIQVSGLLIVSYKNTHDAYDSLFVPMLIVMVWNILSSIVVFSINHYIKSRY